MTPSGSGITISIVIHIAIISLIAVIAAEPARVRHAVAIDLGLLQPAAGATSVQPRDHRMMRHRPSRQPESIAPEAVSPPEPEHVPVPESRTTAEIPSDLPGGDGESGDGGSIAREEGLRTTYINEYLASIRDRIVRNLAFPPVARQMGWSGRTTVSFVICRNGSIENLRIVHSTGHAVLDRSVARTIERVAPFPRPPVEVEITLPIHFQLL